MRTPLSYILLLLVLFINLDAWAQSDRWDRALDSYQTICDRCILLRERSLRGDDISPEELTSLLEQVSSLRVSLQRGSGSMSKAQKERFERIKSRYTEAFSKQGYMADGPVLKVERPAMDLQRVEWSPALRLRSGTGKILRSAQNDNSHIALGFAQNDNRSLSRQSDKLSRHPDKQFRHPEGAKRPKDLSLGLSILGGWSPQSLSYGVMATVTGRKLGVYIKGHSNFKTQVTAAYSCLSDGTSGGAPIWTTGKESHAEWSLGAGGIFRLSSFFSLYTGSGYGCSETLWEDVAGKWAKVDDYSAKGICADTGIIFTKSYFQASAGISTILLKNPTLEISLGVRF
ncbi:MAG: hypothetical protein IKH00_00750 [Bacteroidales bacterium]|nr:hypothetical protein [Bacteroidales bacterium]